MRPGRPAGVFSVRFPPPIPFVDPWRRVAAVGVASARPAIRRGTRSAVGRGPNRCEKSRSGALSAKRDARAAWIGNTGQPSVFPDHSPETCRGRPGKSTRIIILPRGFLCHNRQRAPGRRCLEKRGGARRCRKRPALRPAVPAKFFRKMERSVQFRKADQTSVFPPYLPESNTERSCKNEGWRSGRVPVRLVAVYPAFLPFFVVGVQAAGLSPPLTHPETADSIRVRARRRWRRRSRRRRGA